MLKRFLIAGAIAAAMMTAAMGQGVTRLCQQSIGSQGQPYCVDVGPGGTVNGQTTIPLYTQGSISGNVGGYDSGSAPWQTATPANSSHAAGVSVGGLFSIPIARTNGGSGGVGNFLFTSTGASVGQYVVRIWDKNPTGTTCTDNSAFVGSNTDNEHLIGAPFTITPSAPAVTTGDANTYAQQSFVPPESFANQDGTAGKNIYACIVTVSTDTADDNKAVYVNATGYQN